VPHPEHERAELVHLHTAIIRIEPSPEPARTAYGLRTPLVFAPLNAASAAGAHPVLSAVSAAGASLAR
jgi:hypothetical protein